MRDDWKKKYFYYGLTLLVVCFIAIIFWDVLQNLDWVKELGRTVFSGLSSVIIGMFIAYLLNPILVCLEKKIFVPFGTFLVRKNTKLKNKDKFIFKFGRSLSILFTLIIFLGLLWEFFWLVTPQIYKSILAISNDIPTYVSNVQTWVMDLWSNNAEQAAWLTAVIEQGTETITNYLNNDLIPKLGSIIVNISSGVLGGVKFVFNFIVGIIVSVYVMAGKEKFGAQLKKMLYAFFSRRNANKILAGVRETDRIFGGFINAKIVDSIIIGILCYIAMWILKLPYTMLISVIVGVTNVIPFFGPFIGAIPAAVLVFFVNPMQCVVFIILIVVLQQLDGNIIGPLILGDSIGISGFWIIVSISVGASMFGLPGMLFGVPICACLYQLLRYLCNHLLRKKALPTDSKEYLNMQRIDREHHIVEKEEKNLAETVLDEELQPEDPDKLEDDESGELIRENPDEDNL